VRFTYHPGAPALKDNSGLMCEECWHDVAAWLGASAGATDMCLRCGAHLREGRLVVIRPGQLSTWTLCRLDAVEFLNNLRTVEPKLDAATFRFPVLPPGEEAPH
jgi:hypothetical protein